MSKFSHKGWSASRSHSPSDWNRQPITSRNHRRPWLLAINWRCFLQASLLPGFQGIIFGWSVIIFISSKIVIPLQIQDLQQESEHLNEAAPSYLSSGQQAAARAEWTKNPQALPPMALRLGWRTKGGFDGDVSIGFYWDIGNNMGFNNHTHNQWDIVI